MNTEVMQELRNAAKIQPGSRETFPSNLSGSIVPVIEINPKVTKTALIRNTTLSNSTTITILTTPTNQDLYLSSASVSLVRDATATSTSQSLRCTINGLVVNVLTIPSLTLTAQNDSTSINFPHPVKVDRGTNIVLTATSATGNFSFSGNISFFIDEQSDG